MDKTIHMKYFYLESLNRKYIYPALSILLGGLLLFVSVLPHSVIEETPYPQISDIFDASMHFLGFCLFDFFLLSFVLAPYIRPNTSLDNSKCDLTGVKKYVMIYFCIVVLWGLLCEGSQLFIPSRSFQFIDILANTLPSLIIYILAKKLLLTHDM